MENKNPMTFKSDLTPEFGGAVLMNEAAKKDKAVMAALRNLEISHEKSPGTELGIQVTPYGVLEHQRQRLIFLTFQG